MKKGRKESRMEFRTYPKVSFLNEMSTIGLILLMLIYLVMTVISSAKLAEQTEIISSHPFEVVISAGNVKMYVSEMNVRTGRLARHHGSEDIEIANRLIEGLYSSLETPIAEIEKLYLGDAEDIADLKNILSLLHDEQDKFFSFVSTQSGMSDKIESYEQQYLQPLYEEAINATERIIATAQRKKVGYGETSELLRKSSLAASVALMLLMVLVLLMSRHILRRQRKELLFRNSLFDNLSLSIDDTFVIRDAVTGKVNYCGLNMKRVLGFDVRDGDNIYQGISDEDAAEIRSFTKNPEFKSPYEKIVEYTMPGGEKRWLSIRVYRTDNAGISQLITVFSDRTEEIMSRQALQTAMMNSEQANAAKSAFLSRMSHEIRTPLNAIIGMTTIASASVHDPVRMEDCLEKINLSSKHLLMLINDVLDMSKIESNKVMLQEEPFDIFQVLNGFVSTVYAQAKAKGIEFTEKTKDFGKYSIFIGDSLRLNQILLNLSSNAIKFTEPGGKISLEVTRIISKNKVDIIRFVLSDTGIGMTQEAVDRIFKPFEQADASISGRYGGTGLGMSITQNLVMLMNGQIRVDSESGAGTTFIVDLPFRRGADDIMEPTFENQGLRALIVDDEESVCIQTSTLLDKLKISSKWTVSGRDAVEMAKEAHENARDFDLCLIDWKMPDMDGIEVTRCIHEYINADIPVVLISAYDITEVEKEARMAGVKGFLPKPLYRSSVYMTIKKALNGNVADQDSGEFQDSLKGMRLLVAEDNELNQEIIVELLKMNGAQVDCVCDGQKALEKFLSSSAGYYDAILMDVQMPVMDGYEATSSIRMSDHPMADYIPIIATTANAFSDDIAAVRACGMDAHVSKPLDINQLCRVLKECIRGNGRKD